MFRTFRQVNKKGKSVVNDLRNFLKRRTLLPLRDFTFVGYLIPAVFLFSAIGVWSETIEYLLVDSNDKNFKGIKKALGAYYLPLIGVACMQLQMESYHQKSSKLMGILFSGILLTSLALIGVIHLFLFLDRFIVFTWGGVIFFTVLGIWLTIVANGNNPHLQTDSVDAATGGDTRRELKGDVDEFLQ